VARIAVIGAAGYVGRLLCSRLRDDGADVVGVIRPTSGFLLDQIGVRWLDASDPRADGRFDVVVNLAYPSGPFVYGYPDQNRGLLTQIEALAKPTGHVVHTSTQAVFGMAMEYPQITAPVSPRRDLLYVESKLELENLLIAHPPAARLDIVRLGNVWGPGSAAWTGELAQRLLFGRPVYPATADGFSNVTDVANLTSYISYLALEDQGESGVRFHHLAELGGLPWAYWIDRMAAHLEVTAAPPAGAAYPLTPSSELRSIMRSHGPRAVARQLNDGRFTSSVVRSVVRVLPERAGSKLRNRVGGAGQPAQAIEEDLFLTVVGSGIRFEPHVSPGWTPPVTEEGSWLAVAAWLDEVGYR